MVLPTMEQVGQYVDAKEKDFRANVAEVQSYGGALKPLGEGGVVELAFPYGGDSVGIIRFPTENLYDRNYIHGILMKSEEYLVAGILKSALKARSRELLTQLVMESVQQAA